MSNQSLKMKYHPAKKEILFTRLTEDGREIAIPPSSKLGKYMLMKGTFVLQDFGNEFFEDIAGAFDGLETLRIEVTTTKLDYEDFLQMVEHYNLGSSCRITPTLLAELPNMDETFEQVKRHGEESIAILRAKSKEFYEIDLSTDSVKEAADSFVKQVDDEVRQIQEKIANLGDSNVSLCFTGVYSSGKSALINAILGYRILPEKIVSETAKMFVIRSPQQDEPVKIVFDIPGGHSEIEWNQGEKCFEFTSGPSENTARAEIQNTINAIKQKPQYEQIKALLDKLNGIEQVSAEIAMYFPIPLDSDTVQFTIYDTPGTDSNYVEHRAVLADALEKQQQSILIFVAKPNGLEGSGNNALLNYVKEAQSKSSKTSIDIARSLFVINWSDTVTSAARKTLQTEKITNQDDPDFNIPLQDKKLLFTTASYAYAARAVKNGIAQPEEEWMCRDGVNRLTGGSPYAYPYRQNRCATSELATEKMISRSDEELETKDSEADQVIVSSGLFALESEIKQYGQKYASAVRAFAIIDSVDKALSKLNTSANSLRESNNKDIADIEHEMETLRNVINGAIQREYERYRIPSNEIIPFDVLKKLFLDSESLDSRVINATRTYLDKEIKGWFFGLGRVKFNKKDRDRVQDKVKGVLKEYTKAFLTQRASLLEDSGTAFMNAVKQAIASNGEISDAAKTAFLSIPSPKVSTPKDITDFAEIYDNNKQKSKFLWMERESLDKEEFLRDTELELQKLASDMADGFSKDYTNSLEAMLNQVKQEFSDHLDQHSVRMRALIEDKAAMMSLGDKVAAAGAALEKSQRELDRIIWEEQAND